MNWKHLLYVIPLTIIIGFLISPSETVYNFPSINFVKNVTHGDDYNFTMNDIIIAYRIRCKHFNYYQEGMYDVIDINMCEECWEGIDCYRKTWDTVKQVEMNLTVIQGIHNKINNNITDLCHQVVESGFFTITYKDFIDYQKENSLEKEPYIAYKRLFDKKCKQDLSVFDVNLSRPVKI